MMAESQQGPPEDESSDCITLAVSIATDENGVRAGIAAWGLIADCATILIRGIRQKTIALSHFGARFWHC
jgi:hypothetical protein